MTNGEEERQATPSMFCFDLDGVEEDDKTSLLAGIKGNENAGKDKGYKQVVTTHGPAILGTIYSLSFECALRAQAFLKVAEYKLDREEYFEVLSSLAQGKDINAMVKMIMENRTDYSAKGLVNPAVAGDVALTGEALPGRFAALKDPMAALKRQELKSRQKKEKDWKAKEKEFKALGVSDDEIAAQKEKFFAGADEKFDGNLDASGEDAEPGDLNKVKEGAVDGAASGASQLAAGAVKSLGNLWG